MVLIWITLWVVSGILIIVLPKPYSYIPGVFMPDAAILSIITLMVLGWYSFSYCMFYPPGSITTDHYLVYPTPLVILISVILLYLLIIKIKGEDIGNKQRWKGPWLIVALSINLVELLGALSSAYTYFCYPIPYFR